MKLDPVYCPYCGEEMKLQGTSDRAWYRCMNKNCYASTPERETVEEAYKATRQFVRPTIIESHETHTTPGKLEDRQQYEEMAALVKSGFLIALDEIDKQPTSDVVQAIRAIKVIQERAIREVIDGLKDLIADRRSFAQEPDDIFSRDIQILESAIALIQPMASPIQKHTEK